MRINPVTNSLNTNQNNKTNFGHTFRVSICTKNADGIYTYVSPAKNKELYRQLNKKVVGFLNEDFITKLREGIKFPRKLTKKKTPHEAEMKQALTEKLSSIDSDYKQANYVRTIRSNNSLDYIATGVDVPIIEEFMGADGIGVSKSIAKKSGLPVWETNVRDVVAEFRQSAHEYAKSPTQLLRTPDDKEIMLRVNFNEIPGKRGGKTKYEIADFDFKELKTKQLQPLTAEDKSIKKEIDLNWANKRFLKHSFDKIYEANKPKITPKEVLSLRDNFTKITSQKTNITHDLPV